MKGSFIHKMKVIFRATVIQSFRLERRRREASEQYRRELAESYKKYQEKYGSANDHDVCSGYDCNLDYDDSDLDYDDLDLDCDLDYEIDCDCCCELYDECYFCPDFDGCSKKKRRKARKMRQIKKHCEEKSAGIGAIL